MAKEPSILDSINSAAKTVNNVKKAAKPPKKKKKKTTTKTVYRTAPAAKTAGAPKAAAGAGGGVNVVETLRLIETHATASGDAKIAKLFKKFAKATMKGKPNNKIGNKLMDKFGLLSDASAEIKKLL